MLVPDVCDSHLIQCDKLRRFISAKKASSSCFVLANVGLRQSMKDKAQNAKCKKLNSRG